MIEFETNEGIWYLGASTVAAAVGVILGSGVSADKDIRNATILSNYE